MEEYKRKCIKKGLKVGTKIKYSRIKYAGHRKPYVIVTKGVVTGLYSYIFTVEMEANKHTVEGYKNTIRTSFLYAQVINGEVELWN